MNVGIVDLNGSQSIKVNVVQIVDQIMYQVVEYKMIDKIRQWHKDRKITVNGNSLTQTVKLGEEFGELCSGIVRKDKAEIQDAIGDMVVVLVAIAELEGLKYEDCIESAYNEIKDRTGHLNEHGNYIKD